MKIGSSLALICVGAILAFAVTANTSVLNLHTAGWVLMLIGVIGLLLPGRTAGWLGRQLLVRRSYPSGRVEHIPVPPYVARNPGVSPLLFDGAPDPSGGALRPDPCRPGLGLTIKDPNAAPYRIA